MVQESNHFSNPKTQSEFPFPHSNIVYSGSNLYLLKNSISYLYCSLYSSHAIGDHDVFYCNVKEINVNSQEKPLLYYKTDYYTLETKQINTP
jgi:flavin reductase (DIM6/NTAB) family NADH-FMN oxidoreductase RutF